jgi:DNA-binding NarL/FixJ family response regulator
VVAAVRLAAVAAASVTAAGLAAALRRQRDAAAPASTLSERERQVLQLLVAGQSVPSLAGSLHISSSTAKTYVARLYEKLGVRNRAEAVLAAVYLGLAGPTGPATGARPVRRAELVADPGAA